MSVRDNIGAAVAGTQLAVEQMHADLQAGLAQFIGNQRLDAARPVNMDTLRPINGRGRLVGWTMRAITGPCVVNLRNGISADAADLVATVSLGTGSDWQHDALWMGPTGVAFTEGLFVEIVGGTAAGVLYIGAVD